MRVMHSRAWNTMNRQVRHLRWGKNRLRFLTPEEKREWDQRISEICDRRKMVKFPDPEWDQLMSRLA